MGIHRDDPSNMTSNSRLTPRTTHRHRCLRADAARNTSQGFLSGQRSLTPLLLPLGVVVILLLQVQVNPALADQQQQPQHELQTATGSQKASEQAAVGRSTQPSIDRQVDTPNSGPSSIASAPSVTGATAAKDPSGSKATGNEIGSSASSSSGSSKAGKPNKSPQQTSQQQRKYLASQQQNYDKYQLKATNSQSAAPMVASPPAPATGNDSAKDSSGDSPSAKETNSRKETDESSPDAGKQSSSSEPINGSGGSQSAGQSAIGHKKAAATQQQANRVKASSFSLLKKLLPSFMTSAGPAAAAAAAVAASAAVDRHQVSRSRSSSSSASSGAVGPLSVGSFTGSADGPLSRASGKLINYILSGSKKSAGGAVPDHAPFFIRKPSIDRQAGFASGLLSNPLGLGLLFSAPLIPSLLLTPLAIAGLSPAMSAINNFFGDDEEANTQASSPLSMLTGSSSPLSSILQGSNSPFLQAAAGSSSSNSQDSPRSSLALQAVQSFLGPTSTTERPLFNPGMFASQGIQNAMANLNSGSPSSSSSSSASSSSSGGLSQQSSNNSPIRNFLGGNFIQTAASMISPSFAAPPTSGSSSSPSSSSSSDSDDGPGLIEMASSVFDKVSNYMNTDKDSISTASSNPNKQSSPPSALSSLVGLSSYSPFQLSSLFASSPIASAVASPSSSSSGHSGPTQQRAGFFSTLKNVYELFSSSFLRRQADVGDSNECQQRLICELHQRAMNSKLFRRSVQANLMELANLDKNLQEQIRLSPMQARVDADTKAMLNDFLKATNNFKSGRDVVDCSKMFPKCSRAMLLSTANSHLMDPKNSKAIGKFSNFMKKMKFKSNQQHQSQWKLRKPTKSANLYPQPLTSAGQYQATDYLQVAPMPTMASGPNNKAQSGQLAPVDSLKLVQQIMMMSQQAQQQQQQQQSSQAPSQPQSSSVLPSDPSQSYIYPAPNEQSQSSNQMYSAQNQMSSYQSNYPQHNQYPQSSTHSNGQSTMTNTFYTDANPQQMYSSSPPTSSPYYSPPQSYHVPEQPQHQHQYGAGQDQSQSQLQPQQSIQQLQSYQQYPAPSAAAQMTPEADKKLQQQSTAGQQVKPVGVPAA